MSVEAGEMIGIAVETAIREYRLALELREEALRELGDAKSFLAKLLREDSDRRSALAYVLRCEGDWTEIIRRVTELAADAPPPPAPPLRDEIPF